MRHLPIAATVALVGFGSLACGGGPRDPGIAKKEHDRTLIFVPYDEWESPDDDTCGDLESIDFELQLILADYFALAVDEEGTSIEVSWCDGETNCGPSDPEVTLDVNGTFYAGGTVAAVPFTGWEGCDSIDIDLQWRVDDGGEVIDVEREILISIPNEGTCPDLEAYVQDRSNSGLGLDGCVVQSGFTADYLQRCKFGSNSYSCVGNGSDD